MAYCRCHYRRNVDEEYRRLERTWRESRDPEVRLQLRRIDERTGKVYDANFVCCNLPMREEPAFWARTLTCEDCNKTIKVCCNQKMSIYGSWPDVTIACQSCGYEKDFG